MAKNSASVERLKSGVDRFVTGAVDATVHLPLGIYDRARDQLSDLDAKRLRKTFEGLLEDFIDRGQDRVQPLERRLKREGRKAQAEVSETGGEAKKTTRSAQKSPKKATQRPKKTTKRPSN